MEAAVTHPTAHTAHGASEQLPFSEENQTAHTAKVLPVATELQAKVLPGLSPTGSPPCWQHEGTKIDGLSWALRHQAQAESWPQPILNTENPQLEEEGVQLIWGTLEGSPCA